jgi:hypothetical protein
MMTPLRLQAIAFGAAFALSASAATASVITISAIDGKWAGDTIVADKVNPDGSATTNPWGRGSYSPHSGADTNRVEWGWEWEAGPSAYVFEATTPPITVDDPLGGSEVRILGSFTHENRPIIVGGPVLRSADLQLRIQGTINGEAFDFTPTFSFEHDETANDGGDDGICEVGTTPCSDVVTVSGSANSDSVIEAGGYSYRMYLDGFVDTLGGVPTDEFITAENADNTSLVQWRIVRDPLTAVPLPAAAWMLLAGIGGLGLAARRKRS